MKRPKYIKTLAQLKATNGARILHRLLTMPMYREQLMYTDGFFSCLTVPKSENRDDYLPMIKYLRAKKGCNVIIVTLEVLYTLGGNLPSVTVKAFRSDNRTVASHCASIRNIYPCQQTLKYLTAALDWADKTVSSQPLP